MMHSRLKAKLTTMATLSENEKKFKQRSIDGQDSRRNTMANLFPNKPAPSRRYVRDENRVKEMKDERYKYLTNLLCTVTVLEPETVENFLACDENFGQFDEFLNVKHSGRKFVTLFYQDAVDEEPVTPEGKRLFVANPSVDPLTGMCITFTRTTNCEELKQIFAVNIAQEVAMTCFDVTKASLLSTFADMLSRSMVPPLKCLDDWGQLSHDGPEDFILSLEKFIQILQSAEDGIRGKTALARTANEELIDTAKMPAECLRLASSSEVVAEFEAIIDIWLGQIEQVLTESDQMRREAHDAGPSAELIYWKARLAKFANLIEEIRSQRCQAVVRLLHVAKSRKVQRFRELDGRVTVAMNEARDNVKYLYTLDTFLSQLARCGPTAMVEHLPGLMNAIGMIYAVSQYYNTSDRMTSLFVKITNQMIRSCKNYIMCDATKVWDIDRHVFVQRAEDCCKLNARYQETFQRAKTRLQESNTDRQFEFSENYVFGKFDGFCSRLQNVIYLVKTIGFYNELGNVKLEGLDPIVNKFKTVADAMRRKSYDFLDIRKDEFDTDYTDFQRQIDVINGQLQKYVDAWFEKPLSVEKFIQLLEKFEALEGIELDLSEKYSRILQQFSRDLENVKRIYQKNRLSPPSSRNLPPIASKIAWVRQLYLSIEGPMTLLKRRDAFIKSSEAKKVVATYNKVAAVLMQYEMQYHQYWCDAIEAALVGLAATIFVQHPHTGQIYVNFDPHLLELFEETRFMLKMGLKIPPTAEAVQQKSTQLKIFKLEFEEILRNFEQIKARIPPILTSVSKSIRSKFEKQLEPGLLTITWRSVIIDNFIKQCHVGLKEFSALVSQIVDLVEVRIETRLKEVAEMPLIEMPMEEAARVADFVAQTEQHSAELVLEINAINRQVESSVLELINLLRDIGKQQEQTTVHHGRHSGIGHRTTPPTGYFICRTVARELSAMAHRRAHIANLGTSQINLGAGGSTTGTVTPAREAATPAPGGDEKVRTQRCGECENCIFFSIMSQLTQQKTDALIRCAAQALDTLRRRLQVQQDFYGNVVRKNRANMAPVFAIDITLTIPNIMLKPSLEEVQQAVARLTQAILKVPHSITLWQHQVHQLLALLNRDASELENDAVLAEQLQALSARQISDHKDVFRHMGTLQSIISANRNEVDKVIHSLDVHADLWQQEPSAGVAQFEANHASYAEYESIIKMYHTREATLDEILPSYQVGPLVLLTENLRLALVQEARAWKIAYAKALNAKAGQQMSDLFSFFDSTTMKLSRPIKDLDDIRSAMAALKEVRDNEIYVDMTIRPIEEAYALLNKLELVFSDGNAERVDSIGYGWRKLRKLAAEVSDHLLGVQPEFKTELIAGIQQYRVSLANYIQRYDKAGPMEPGIPPREASERMAIFQADFDDLWAKFVSYSGGEELFGLPVTPYPDLQRIKRELGLLQKLYQLYNQVLESVNGYYDISWAELNIDKINTELTEFQNRCRKLPKALKEWKAYDALSKMVNDFTETCPLMELMSNKAMQKRHWERIENLTGHKFDYESDSFCLRDLMKAPLLKYREDIEDICISAVKEKDIEAKLKIVIADWSARSFTFGAFKNKGELLLKGDTVQELVAALEDSLMVLGSLMSNRYNVPFKPQIQDWVSKLSQTSEIIEKWMYVQNLWVYLEAVFVGGDIAKQLPAEAKRFSNIDKSWVNVMRRAHENSLVVVCCTADDTLAQILPHLSEQLELCQKSLAGYLEKKRLLFPRFFFVSDPQLLEILGQASDSHTIQAHLLSIFDNTKYVRFDEKIYDRIVAVVSSEGEVVSLENYILATGNVEGWLAELLKESRRSLNAVIRGAWITIQDVSSFKLLDFENQFPAQVGLLGIQMIWTRDAEEALYAARHDKKAMNVTNQHFLDILNELIDVTTKELSKFERVKFETLITIHVHQRDIFDDLVKAHIKSVFDFEWLKQSRFYFREEEDRCIVSITNVDFIYQNEFLGCTDRLVITPLTDRCYITLAQALGMAMGGAPAGPAGTGKTETTKDMGRCLGKYVVVFNCSDQMDYRGLGRIYKGLAQSGSWGCFDEFNRIDLPVLSVAAQQIAIILSCKKEKRSQFVFTDGDIVDMDPEFGLFLTMNPGYAGRQELPENLKINFRTCAMMVPDRAIIMRVKLASAGFQQNVMLSKKFYTLYKLCEEQLSKQVHYDFGLRNILSVLRTLGTVKRGNPNDPEPAIVMRVLRDMNLSKLVDEDEPLFMSLIEDLFPGMVLSKAGYPQIEAAIDNQVKEAKLINHPPWTLKLIQLYETQRVRHGIMTLGPTGAGKSKCINILLKAMTDCGSPHKEWRMNPKAITAPQMFGRLDVATNDWTDGIFSTLWRKSLKIKKTENVWIILDGPVDAIWIENLNSVLDDNKTLTLANGDRIPMAPTCKLVFEVDVIDNASPATVSRMGMVYMSSSQLDWQPILRAWLLKRPPNQEGSIFGTFDCCFTELYTAVSQVLTPKMNALECIYIRQAIDLLDALLAPFEDQREINQDHLRRLIIFAIMWSLGALLELGDRRKFEETWRSLPAKLPLPPVGDDTSMFEYVVDENGDWQHWGNRVPEYNYPKDTTPEYTSILVPNVDNIRTDFLIDLIARQGKAVLLIGEQGTAKTVILKGYGLKYNPELHMFKAFNFSSATTPLMVQRTIESYVDKRVGTTYGPPSGKKMTIFIDDINMPVINEWGDQVTNEITRQMMENVGFYNLEKPGEFTSLVDIQFVAAMPHPGGGRNDIPNRLKRQFNIFNCTLPSNASIDKIFGTLAFGHFCTERNFQPPVIEMIQKLIPATRKVWQRVKVRMLPTPAKFHYVFNLRDLSRIWQGMLNTVADVISTPSAALALWKHECCRVIADRFTIQQDKEWFDKALKTTIEEDCGASSVALMPQDPLFLDFLREAPEATGEEGEEVDFEAPKIYEPVTSLDQLQHRLHSFMDQYNTEVRGANMDLVFFKDAMTHLLKISRIIRTPRGNALLVGVGGSGKQSLTRLASFIAGYKTFQITLHRSYGVTHLMEDLKYLFRTAGMEGKGITFIFTDNEIKDESFLEYMNNVLASGEVSNLFARDENDEMMGELIPIMKRQYSRRPPTPENLYDYYLSRVRTNLHVVLCFSPVGEKFRSRALKFPALISGCTVDWFQRWPKDALQAVSRHFLADFDIVCTPQVKNAVMSVMGEFQDQVADVCGEYFERFRRQTSVTPKSYLSFIAGFKTIYEVKRVEIGSMASRMNTGLQKLVEATQSVNELSKLLVVKEKELAIASAEADKVLADVTVSAQAAEAVKRQVQVVKDKAQTLYDIIMADKRTAESKLQAAKPALAEAEAALQTIKPAHIATVRKLGKPPHLIMRIMDCVLLLFQRHVDPLQPDPERPCPKPSWGEALRLMGGNFLNGLLNFPKDTINEETVELMLPYFDMEDYNLETAKKVCGDVAGLCSWTKAMATFFGINKEVLPLKANLVVQEARLADAEKKLKIAQGQLDEKQRELDAVMAIYNAAMARKQTLIEDAEACRRKMNNAMLLIDGLAGEKIRWTEASQTFAAQIQRLVGDVLLCTGFLSYVGPFNQEFRSLLIRKWKKEMATQKIPFTEDLKIVDMLVDPATIGEWNIQGLPNDELSTQNGLIVTKAARYPLLIDPQGQGKTWIKNRESGTELQITTLNHKYFRQHLEDCLSLGRPLLIEDIAEDLDPVLDNVLEKNFIRQGSRQKVKLGDKEVDYSDGFRLYITTKMANPAYRPEIAARTAIIDFTVTLRGLEDQLLSIVIVTEKADLEKARKELVEEVMANKKKMKELEDNLLFRLTSTEGSLVDDDKLIEVLFSTKATAEEVKEKLRVAGETEVQITSAREEFRPVAARGSILYFLIVEMSMVNCMYQTSLKQFLGIFDNSMAKSTRSPYTNKRIQNIIDYLTFDVFKYTCRGLYERDKFMFTLQMAIKVQLQQKVIRPEEFQVFIKGGAALDLNGVEPKPKKWITDMTWLNLVELSNLIQFTNILKQVAENDKNWKAWFDSEAPEEVVIPDGYSALPTWYRLLLVRSWCPDRTAPMARKYVAEALGESFAEPVILNWEAMWEESTNRTPMISFLSTGADPTEDIERLGKKLNVRTGAISMGQGQEVHARRLIQQGMQEGRWVLFQNCHLGLAFMDELLETVTEAQFTHQDFRCWVTTEPHPLFPINLLQTSIKFTNEPPQGVRAGLKRTYGGLTQELIDYTNAPQWRPMLYCVAFLHTAVQERRKFGPIGWNIPYEFNQADFTSTVQFVQNHLDDMDPKKGVSWSTVAYMIGEVQYGGRVTDDYDKRLLNTYARVWFRDAIFTDQFEFGKGYRIPKCKSLDEYRTAIEQMTAVDSPECFGLHPNADIIYQTNTANSMLSTVLSIQPKDAGTGGGETREATVYRLADDMLQKLPVDYNPHEVKERLKKMGHLQPLNIFLRQEIARMQRVISAVRTTLSDLRLAIDGTIIMNESLKDALDALFDALIPAGWRRVSWDSATLGFWFTDLLDRNTQFYNWIMNERPESFWLTGFFNPQGFLTAMRQEIARAHKGWALDAVVLANDVTKLNKEDVNHGPQEGVYIHGLHLEGAGWDRRNCRLVEPTPKVLYTQMPVIWVYAVNADNKPKPTNFYDCPVYKKPRRTDLTYIFPLQLKTAKDPDHWALRGVALLCDTK